MFFQVPCLFPEISTGMPHEVGLPTRKVPPSLTTWSKIATLLINSVEAPTMQSLRALFTDLCLIKSVLKIVWSNLHPGMCYYVLHEQKHTVSLYSKHNDCFLEGIHLVQLYGTWMSFPAPSSDLCTIATSTERPVRVSLRVKCQLSFPAFLMSFFVTMWPKNYNVA